MTQPHLHIALATCAHHPGFCAGDDEALAAQLAPLGFTAHHPIWNDPAVDWTRFDAVLVRTTWDYTHQLSDFLAWMRRVESTTPLFNPSALAEDNLDKTYLKRLGDAAVPTEWCAPGEDPDAALDRAAALGWDPLVIKPAVGAGAEDLLITSAADRPAGRAHIQKIQRRASAMLQPLIEGVRTRGELSVVLIDGAPTHAVRKTPTAGDYRVQIEFGGLYAAETPPPAALRAAAAAAVLWTTPPLYARIDLVEPEPGVFRIIEVELVEPELFFPWAPHAGAALASALRARLAAGSTMGA